MTKRDYLTFAEWAAENFVKMNLVWVHRYNNQQKKENWMTTDELYNHWLDLRKLARMGLKYQEKFKAAYTKKSTTDLK
jgi:hypothetical protein